MDLHEKILTDNGKTWRVGEPFLPVLTDARRDEVRRMAERRNADHGLWGFKDPRSRLFLTI